jgi:hypothetical protein
LEGKAVGSGFSSSWKARKETYKKAISHGTKRSPAQLKMCRKAARKGAPKTNAIKPAFKDISDKNDGRRLVESMFLLKDEGPVHFQRMHWEG